jgi:hypothetical protein
MSLAPRLLEALVVKTRLQGSFELPGVLSSRNAITASAASGSLALLHPGAAGASLIEECFNRVLTRSCETWASSAKQCASQRDRNGD